MKQSDIDHPSPRKDSVPPSISKSKNPAPAIDLPKGGGAIKGISEKFTANPVTGTASLSIPLPVSPARGFESQLGLHYDSGSGNGPFGLGWNLGIPSIGRKTEKGLPQYLDAIDSDTYTLDGAEDLVPLLKPDGENWQGVSAEKVLAGIRWEVTLYRPRIEGAFSKIERWRNPVSGVMWWRTTSGTNITSVYGFSESARITDPTNSTKIFKWLIDCSYDDKGHFTKYVYKSEDLANIDYGLSYEMHRKGNAVAQRYLKRVLYGIKQPYWMRYPDTNDVIDKPFREDDFHFQTVFDYGEHSELEPSATETAQWDIRQDPFSSYRAGFEIRTYRRCRRVLLFHQFENELPTHCEPISAVAFDYDDQTEGFSFLTKITRFGYKRDQNGVLRSKSLPPMTFAYQPHAWNAEVKTVDRQSLQNLPSGVEGTSYQWLDLYSEGLSGVLTEQAGGLYYKQNLGGAVFAEAQLVAPAPSVKGFATGGLQIQDLESNGRLSLVSITGQLKGYYTIDDQAEWENFQAFREIPNIDFQDPNLRMIDLDGDGRPDLLLSEDQAFRWYPSAGEQGFGKARMSAKAKDEDSGPAVVFANDSESIFLADMSGDGLQDIVRIRNGSVVYWPNLGYGHFGAKNVMSHSPKFDYPDLFNPRHIRLADLDGSGTTDIVYLGNNEFRYWLNLSGNQWSSPYSTINPFPEIDNLSTVSVIDLLGTGTACVVWSSLLPKHTGQSMKYIDLMDSTKPHLMTSYENGMGKHVTCSYTPSTQFYLEDRANSQPWLTKLHFPVHCLSKIETFDQITQARYVSSYTYHHGYFDHAEREFRGFGRVDQIDTEEYEHFVARGSSNVVEQILHQPPVLTKTWFHTGYYLDQQRILSQYQHEYFSATALEHIVLEEPALSEYVTAAEWREALRACKGLALHSEVYGLDGSDKELIPYSIAHNTCDIKLIQPKQQNKYASFQVINSESLMLQLDRNPDDPRISHNLVLQTDAYGNPLLSAAVGYPRQIDDLSLPVEVRSEQGKMYILISQTTFTNDRYGILGSFDLDEPNDATYCLPVSWKTSSDELRGVADPVATVFSRTELLQAFENARPVSYEDRDAIGLIKRRLTQSETRFINDSFDDALAAGELNPLGIIWQSYQLAFTSSLLQSIYGDKVDVGSMEGGYLDLNADGNWWVSSGTPIFGADAAQRFYTPIGAHDPFGNPSWIDLDDYLLLPISSRDALQNEVLAFNDYRTLSPQFVRDPNQNWMGVESDELSMVIKSAVMGKVTGLNEEEKPAANAISEGDNLDYPSAELRYDFYDPVTNQPAHAYSKTYVNHHAVDPSADRPDFLQQYEYSDGSGQVIMIKAQAEPGLAKRHNADGSIEEIDTGAAVRWIGNGRTILNNKGNPVKQYEPYFSVTFEYEDDPALVEIGITPILFYDAAGRNNCKLYPNHTYDKVVFDPWQQTSWDVNDTLFIQNQDNTKDVNPANDPHVGHYFAALDLEEYLPSWYAARIQGDLGQEQKRAAQKSEAHASTSMQVYTDALGQTIYGVADNGEFGKYKTSTVLDIEGNTLAVVDDRDNAIMAYAYNMLPPPDEENPKPALYQNSMDGGEKWTLFNVLGNPVMSWDSRNHVFETKYDEVNRPTESWVRESGVDKLIGLSRYHDSDSPDADAIRSNNLIGAAYEIFDQAGLIETLAYDFKGNAIRMGRTFAEEYKETVDWNVVDPRALLQTEYFESTSEYDALNRPTHSRSPHNQDITASETWLAYNESGALDYVDVATRGGKRKQYVSNIDYDAKGQRKKIDYGNGVVTDYTYEPDTYRLQRLHSKKTTGEVLQDLNYTYDPAGNIAEILDKAQQTHFFSNDVVEPHTQYIYDSLYRLIEATGREHAGQNSSPSHDNGWQPEVHPNDGNAMRRYTQSYVYDGVGNIRQMSHRASGNGWTRNYQYADEENRLLATTVGDPELPFDEKYQYNVHGSMTSMPQLPEPSFGVPSMDWDFVEQLHHVDLIGGGHAWYVYDASGQRTRKIIDTNGTTVKERIYLGGWEIYRETVAGKLRLERETLHVVDDKKRIAVVETKTVSDGAKVTSPASVIRYQLGNHLGSASLELSDDGHIISYEEFHPYGTTAYYAGTGVVEESPKRYRYTGKERDEETGFSSHGARYLAVWLGRWIAADPLGIKDGVNLYGYVHGNPVTAIDSSGRSTLPFLILLGSNSGPIPPNSQSAFTPEDISRALSPVTQPIGEAWTHGGNNFLIGGVMVVGGVLLIAGSGGMAAPALILLMGSMSIGAGALGAMEGSVELTAFELGYIGNSPNAIMTEVEAAEINRYTGAAMAYFGSPGGVAGGTVGLIASGGELEGLETGAAIGGLTEFAVVGVAGGIRILAGKPGGGGQVIRLSRDANLNAQHRSIPKVPGLTVLDTHGGAGVVEIRGSVRPVSTLKPIIVALAEEDSILLFACNVACDPAAVQRLANSTRKTIYAFDELVRPSTVTSGRGWLVAQVGDRVPGVGIVPRLDSAGQIVQTSARQFSPAVHLIIGDFALFETGLMGSHAVTFYEH